MPRALPDRRSPTTRYGDGAWALGSPCAAVRDAVRAGWLMFVALWFRSSVVFLGPLGSVDASRGVALLSFSFRTQTAFPTVRHPPSGLCAGSHSQPVCVSQLHPHPLSAAWRGTPKSGIGTANSGIGTGGRRKDSWACGLDWISWFIGRWSGVCQGITNFRRSQQRERRAAELEARLTRTNSRPCACRSIPISCSIP